MTGIHLSKYAEGGNLLTLVAVPACVVLGVVFYPKIAPHVAAYGIDAQVLYSYVLNVFAIEFGALVSLFALIACRPTQFLERIRNTAAFRGLLSNIKVTLTLSALVLAYTCIIGVLKLEPTKTLDAASIAFFAWATLAVVVTCFYGRTIRLTFVALT